MKKIQKKCIVLIILLTMILSYNASAENWSSYKKDSNRSGFTSEEGPTTSNILWLYSTTGWFSSSPSIYSNNVYIGVQNSKKIISLNKYGKKNWEFGATGEIRSTPTIDNGKLVSTCRDGKIYCLDTQSGEKIWSYTSGGWSDTSPLISNNIVYVVSYDSSYTGILYSLYLQNGTKKWTYPGISIISSPALSNNNIYVSSDDGKLLCINSDDGVLIWEKEIDPLGIGGTAAIKENLLYVMFSGFMEQPQLFCLDINNNGEIKWSYDVSIDTATSPSVDNNYVYFVDYADPYGKIICLDRINKNFIWEFETDDIILSTPAITNNYIYFGSNDNYVYCLSKTDGSIIWKYDTGYDVVSSPVISNNKLYIASKQGSTLYCFAENSAPEIPNKPNGVTSGEANVQYSYETNVVQDPDGNIVSYMFNWGDGTTSNWLSEPMASHSWSLSGTFNIKVKSKDEFGLESQWSDSLSVVIEGLQPYTPKLDIDAVSLIDEGKSFEVAVNSNEIPIEGANVEFDGSNYFTNQEGIAIISAPEVDQDADYQIIATKMGYESDSKTIQVKNVVEYTEGWIYGTIYDEQGNIISGAKICAVLTNSESKCVFSDNKGNYLLKLPVGFYEIKVVKDDYQISTKSNIQIQENMANGKNFALSKISDVSVQSDKEFVENEIRKKVEENKISAEIQISKQNDVLYFTDADININIENDEKEIKCTVSAPDGTSSTILVFKLAEDSLQDIKNLEIIYDDIKLEEITDVESFFNLDESINPGWIQLFTKTDSYIFLRVPHFSTHTIKISSIENAIRLLTSPMAFLLYVVIILLGSFVFIGPVVSIAIRNKLRRDR